VSIAIRVGGLSIGMVEKLEGGGVSTPEGLVVVKGGSSEGVATLLEKVQVAGPIEGGRSVRFKEDVDADTHFVGPDETWEKKAHHGSRRLWSHRGSMGTWGEILNTE